MMDRFYYDRPQVMLQIPRITWGVQRIILLTFAMFVLQLVLHPLEVLVGRPGILVEYLGFHPAWFFYGCLWMPITYMFLHGGLLHVFMNMLWVFVFGPEVERLLGTRQFIRFYLLCGICGVLATLLPYLLWGKYTTVIGASGAAMGVLVAFAMINPDRQFFLFPFPIPITAVWLVILVVLFNVIALSGGTSNISVATHFGGMLTGAFLMKAIPLYYRSRWGGFRTGVSRSEKPFSREDFMAERLRQAIERIFQNKSR